MNTNSEGFHSEGPPHCWPELCQIGLFSTRIRLKPLIGKEGPFDLQSKACRMQFLRSYIKGRAPFDLQQKVFRMHLLKSITV